MQRRRALAIVLGATFGGIASPLWKLWRDNPDLLNKPARFAGIPFPDVEGAITGDVLRTVRERLRWRAEMGVPDLLHWLRVFGVPGASEFQATKSGEVVSLLTNVEALEHRFGQPRVIVTTPDGIRFLSRKSGLPLVRSSRPTHPFQELAVFGEIGLAASVRVLVDGAEFELRHAIRDCLMNIQLREGSRQEPEWLTITLAHYLAATSWTNRWNERISFDAWVCFLLDRPVARYCCGGTHLLHALALVLQADRGRRLLRRETRARIRDACRQFRRVLESTQHPDGAWRTDWNGQEWQEHPWADIHMTGHILEAQAFLSTDLRISARHSGRALGHLARSFLQVDDATVFNNFCPFSHAGRVLLLLADSSVASP